VTNREIIPIQFELIERIDLARLLVKKAGKMGVFSSDGKIIVPLEYNDIRQLKNDFLVLIKNNEIEYLYLPENKLLRLN
jgi:hypothetical protein